MTNINQGITRKDSLLNSLKKTPRPLTLDARLSGLIDGEGSIFVYRRKNKKSGSSAHILSLAVTMTTENDIRWIEENFGGRVLPNIPGATLNRKKQHRWHVENEAATEILKAVYPFLVGKKKQAALAFQFREIMKQTFGTPRSYREQKREELANRINSLNMNKGGRRRRVEAVETAHATSEPPRSVDDPVRASERSEEVLRETA